MLERSCGAVVYTERDGQRRYVLVKGGYVGLPKGHMEKGESERETAVREIREETCVSTQIVPGFRRVVTYHMPNGNDKRGGLFSGAVFSAAGPPESRGNSSRSWSWGITMRSTP